MDFLEVACKIGLSSIEVDGVYKVLGITNNTTIDIKTLKRCWHDFPAPLRDWLHFNNPDFLFFAGRNSEFRDDNDFQDFDLIEY